MSRPATKCGCDLVDSTSSIPTSLHSSLHHCDPGHGHLSPLSDLTARVLLPAVANVPSPEAFSGSLSPSHEAQTPKYDVSSSWTLYTCETEGLLCPVLSLAAAPGVPSARHARVLTLPPPSTVSTSWQKVGAQSSPIQSSPTSALLLSVLKG